MRSLAAVGSGAKSETRRLLQNSVAADVSRRKHLKLPRTNVRGYEVLKKPPRNPKSERRHKPRLVATLVLEVSLAPPKSAAFAAGLAPNRLTAAEIRTSDFGLRTLRRPSRRPRAIVPATPAVSNISMSLVISGQWLVVSG